MRRLHLAIGASLSFLLFQAAFGQGLLIDSGGGKGAPKSLPRPIVIDPRPIMPDPRPMPLPRPTPMPSRPVPQSAYKIKEISVQVKMADQVAKAQVSQSFVNTGTTQMEVSFVFPLPYDGAIDQLTLLVDSTEYPAQLLPADQARREYEAIVRSNRDPALLEWIGTGMFKTSVFPVPPGAERKVTLKYSQLCRKQGGMTDFVFPLSTAKYTSHPVEKLDIQVAIESANEIKNVYSPTHQVEIKRSDDKHALISLTTKDQVPTTDFRLMYDIGPGVVGANIVSFRPNDKEDGYFLMLASPQIQAPSAQKQNKTVILVCDRSGSMAGEKMTQAKDALKFVLNNLRAGDLFNIVAYDSRVESYKPELQRFDDETRQAALGWVEGIFAGGSTNIDGALSAALSQLKDNSQPSYVIFLTDGLPTDGEKNEMKLVEMARSLNKVRARLFSFGVGYDVNSRLLDRLARDNFGQSEFVLPNENIEASVSSLYNKIGSPVMTDLVMNFEVGSMQISEGLPVNRMYPAESRDLFAGEQLVVVGRYRKPGPVNASLRGYVAGSEQTFVVPATFVEKSKDDTNSFIEKLWAVRRIGQIIDEMDLKGRNEELVKELVDLSTKHGVLTSYTSFLADERTNRRGTVANAPLAEKALRELEKTDGQLGVDSRLIKEELLRKSNMATEGPDKAASRIAGSSINLPADPFGGQMGGFGGRGGGGGAGGLGGLLGGGAGGARGAAGGKGGGKAAAKAPAQTGRPNVTYFDAAAREEVVVDTVQSIGRKTFYKRGDRWVDGSVSEEQEKTATKLERFSPEYFKLIDEHGKDVAKYLAIEDPIVIELGGKFYSF